MRSNLMRFPATLPPKEFVPSRHWAIFVRAVWSKEDAGCRGALAQPTRGHSPPPPACATAVPDPTPWKQPEARWTAQAEVQACTPPAAQSS